MPLSAPQRGIETRERELVKEEVSTSIKIALRIKPRDSVLLCHGAHDLLQRGTESTSLRVSEYKI